MAPYGVAVLSVALIAAVRLGLDPIFGGDAPLSIFLVAVILTSWYGGLWPGLLATALSVLAGDYLFLAPRYSILRYDHQYDQLRAIFFIMFALLFILLNDRLRKSVEAERESSESFRLLLESVKDYAIFMLDPRGRVVSWNPGAERIKGYRAKEIIGRDFSVFYPPEKVESGKPQRELEIAAVEGRYEESGWQVRKDGTRFWASGVISALHDDEGRLRGFTKITRDVTERRQAEEELSRSKQFVQRIVEVSPSVIYLYDVKRRKNVFINRTIAAALGYDAGEKALEAEFLRSVMHPDDWRPFLDHLRRFAGLSDEEIISFEYRIRHSSGEWRWYQSRDKIFSRNGDGSVREIIGMATDITERKHAEEKIHFIDTLNKALRPLAGPEEIKATAARMLGEHLGADRCAYAEVEPGEEYLEITGDYARGETPSAAGRFGVDDLGPGVLRLMRVNLPSVVNDVEAEASAGTDLSAYRQAEVRALVCAPLHKNGRYVARMAVGQKTPRRWLREEIELITIAANRVWESVERARAVRSLRESEERYRAFIEQSSEAIWRIELEKPVPVALPEDEQIEMFYQFGYLAECNDAMARMYGYERADQILGARVGDLLVKSDPRNIAQLRALSRSGYRQVDVETYEVDRYGNTKYFLNNQTGIIENGAVVRGWGTQRDITELKRAEQAMRESEGRLLRITDATKDALWEIDLKTNRLWWSEGAKPLFGRRPGELEPGLEDWYNSIHPEDVGRVRDRFDEFMASDDTDWYDEYRFRRADGVYLYIVDLGRKFYDESGTPVRVAGAMANITERKQAEEALRASEERYRLLTELSPDGVVIADADGTIHLANQSMLRMLSAAPEQVIGRGLLDFLEPKYLEHCRNCLGALMSRHLPATQIEAAFRRADGRSFPVEVNAVRFDWNGQQFAQFVIHDITGRKQAEAERERFLKEIEDERNRLWQILEQMPIGVIIAEAPSGRLLFSNRESERLLRHPMLFSDDYQGYTQYVARRMDDDPYLPEEYPLSRALISGEVVKDEEMKYRRGDGTETILSVDSAPINDSEGLTVLAVATFIDIAERKRAEEALRASEERYRGVTEAASDVIIAVGDDSRIQLVNSSVEKVFGYTPSEVLGMELTTLMPEYLRHLHKAGLKRYLETGEKHLNWSGIELPGLHKDGYEVPVEIAFSEYVKDGRPIFTGIIRDITERKRAEEALRESEERFAKAFRASPDGLLIARVSDGAILEVNDSFAALSGYDRDELIGKSTILLGLYVDPSDRQRALAILKERNYVRDFEFKVRRKSGEARLITFSAEPLELRGERCWLTIVRDITEQKQAEVALRESEERFEKAFRASPDALVITRLSDRAILEVNDSWVSLFGYDRDEVIGRNWILFDFLADPDDRSRAAMILEERNFIRDFEMAVKRKSGETRLVTFSTELIEIRGEGCAITIIHDVTERKQAEEALRKSEEQTRRQLAQIEAIYATAPVGLCFMDTEYRYISINDRLAEIDGRSVEEHLGRTVREVMPEIADVVEPLFQRVVETGEPALNIERSVATAAQPGVVRHFIVSYYPVKNGGERVLGVNSVVVDITKRKKIEEELERLLRQEKTAREEAETANRMKDDFLATISHELRTPLTSILGWARMLTDGALAEDQARHALEVIAQSAQAQTRLIEDILDTSRIITGRLQLDAHPVRIEHIFQAAVDVVRPSAEAKGIALSATVDVPPGVDDVVFGDASRLQQALWNLLSNAVKFTNEGGRIEARLGRAGNRIEITVSDTGMGIEPQFMPYVFERFHQADSTSTRKYGGLGLGLAIVRHIVEMHGGSVSASSPGKDQGATFKIKLPLVSTSRLPQPESQQAESEAPQAKERKATGNGHRLDGVRVLLVEDNPDTLDMLKFIFDESGAEVTTAASVNEALEALERSQPDALVSDIAMPDRDGYDLIREVRSRDPEHGGAIPAVAVTAFARAEDRVNILAAGFQMHVAKPVDPDELIAVVASLTGQIHF